MILDAKIGAECRDWCWVLGMALDAENGVGQGGACFANFLMGRCSRLPWRHFHLKLLYYEALMMQWGTLRLVDVYFLQADFCTFYFLHYI